MMKILFDRIAIRAVHAAGLTASQRFFGLAVQPFNTQSLGVKGLRVDDKLVNSVRHTFGSVVGSKQRGIDEKTKVFFTNLVQLHQVISPKRVALLQERVRKQVALDAFFETFRKNAPNEALQDMQPKLEKALKEIGYLPEKELSIQAFKSATTGLAPEILTPGPQAVVPADKANMVVNAINGRWGSAYDAVKGSNLLAKGESERDYVHSRLGEVFEFKTMGSFQKMLSFSEIVAFRLSGASLTAVDNKGERALFSPKQGQRFLGYTLNDKDEKKGVLLENNGLKIEITLGSVDNSSSEALRPAACPRDPEILLNAQSSCTEIDRAGSREQAARRRALNCQQTLAKPLVSGDTYFIEDILLEASQTVIIDKEDSSVSATEIKQRSEENIARLIDGSLTAELSGGRGIRRLNPDTKYVDPSSDEIRVLKRTAQMLVRSVSDHMTLPVDEITINGEPVSEKTWDLLLSTMSGVQYHVLPKMHNEKEVALAMRELQLIEALLGMPENYFKVGIMNEEYEMNLRLREALQACRDRVFFVNSGFLDKFGSDLEATMQAGAVGSYRQLNKAVIKLQYEKNNVAISHQAGIAQVGAGMWAKLKDQIGHKTSKDAQIQDGNDVSWDPDPKFAVLHALSYHTNPPVNDIKQRLAQAGYQIKKEDLYLPPLGNFTDPTKDNYVSEQEIKDSLREATFGLIGYATPWITNGIGCSAINDLNGEPLMEDRATARIKVAFLRNWLCHGIITKAQVMAMVEEVSAQIPGVTEPVKQAISELVFNPENEPTALVENAFMRGYQAAHSQKPADALSVDCRM